MGARGAGESQAVHERRRESGQTSVEYLGLLVVVSVITLVLIESASGIGERFVCEVRAQISSLADGGGGSCGDARRARHGSGTTGAVRDRASDERPAPAPPHFGSRRLTTRSAAATRSAAGSGRRARAARRRLNGVIKGRKIDTSNYRRKDYCNRYRCRQPSKTQYPMPNFQGRRDGKLRINLFIKQGQVRPGGVAPVVLEGDDRGFDKNFDALRTRVAFVFDFKTDKLTVLVNPSCSKGTSVIKDGCSSPNKDNKVTVAAGPNGRGDRDPYSVDYSLKNSRTGVPLIGNPAPAIDGRIAIRPIRDSRGRRRLKVTIYNDGYPSIEGYYDPPDRGGPREVCQSSEGSASDLAGATSKRCDSVA